MTFKSKEEVKAYHKLYYQKNKEKIKEHSKLYYENNKDAKREYQRNYINNNEEKLKEYWKKYKEEYKNTEKYIKSRRISNWKFQGVICDDWNALHDKYVNTTNCEECDVELIFGNYGSNKKCLNHDRVTGEFRNVLCNLCNCRRR